MVHMMLGYFFWDPSPEMFEFNLPILERPILWYGFFFAFGYFLAYFVFLYLLKRYLLGFPKITKKDFEWPIFLNILQHPSAKQEQIVEAILGGLSSKMKSACLHWKAGKLIDEALKEALINSCNEQLEESSHKHSISKGLAKELKRMQPADIARQMKQRLYLEDTLFPGLSSLKQRSKVLAERFTIYTVIGTVVGARIGEILFYQNFSSFIHDPLMIFRVWEGGLASHGGALGVLIALLILSCHLKDLLNWRTILDLVLIPTALVASFIRIGNFFNQEILGTVTSVPWAVIFGHPADHSPPMPRHPAQLYEAIWYFLVFILLFCLWQNKLKFRRMGKISGLFLILVFTFRFFVEFLKPEQSPLLSANSVLDMGQYLSIPFIGFGLFLYFWQPKNVLHAHHIKGK